MVDDLTRGRRSIGRRALQGSTVPADRPPRPGVVSSTIAVPAPVTASRVPSVDQAASNEPSGAVEAAFRMTACVVASRIWIPVGSFVRAGVRQG